MEEGDKIPPPPLKDHKPTMGLLQGLLDAKIEKLNLTSSSILVVRSPKSLRKMNPQEQAMWAHAALKAINKSFENMGLKNIEVMVIDEDVRLEEIPTEDLRKILNNSEEVDEGTTNP